MDIEQYTKKMYDSFGDKYQKTRDKKDPSRAFNNFLEVPCMIKAVGNVKGKKLLDIGCGAGVHAEKYYKKGAKVFGIDISKTMIDLAKKRCPKIDFKVCSMKKLPYKNSSFHIVTASLCLDYIKNLNQIFKEVNRVLKKEGLFYYSDSSPIESAMEKYEDKNFKIKGIGVFKDKKTGKIIHLGKAFLERVDIWDMLPGMFMKTYSRTLRTKLKALIKSNFELIDFIDCKPIPAFKKYNPEGYKFVSRIPMFSIAVARKK